MSGVPAPTLVNAARGVKRGAAEVVARFEIRAVAYADPHVPAYSESVAESN